MFFQEKKEQFAIWAEQKLSRDYPRKTLWKFFATGGLINLISWVVPLILPSFVADPAGIAINIEGRIAIYLMAIPLFSAALMAYSAMRIFGRPKPEQTRKGEVFRSYADRITSERDRNILLIALAFGGANCVLLFFVVIWGRMWLYP